MSFRAYYKAWDADAGELKTGDASNHTITAVVDQADVTGLSATEAGDGVYYVDLTDAQCPKGARFALRGSSSTDDVIIIGESGIRPEDMRGTDGAYTGTPPTPPTKEEIATQVEKQIINETDSEKVLKAITDKIAAANPSLSDLTLAAIASQVRTELTTELARIDAKISSRLAESGYTKPPSKDNIAASVWGETSRTLTDGVDINLAQSTSGGSTVGHQLDAAGTGSGGGGGGAPGGAPCTITLEDENKTPIPAASVWIYAGDDRTRLIQGPLVTDDNGRVTANLIDGNTYYRWARCPGYNFTNPEQFTASVD